MLLIPVNSLLTALESPSSVETPTLGSRIDAGMSSGCCLSCLFALLLVCVGCSPDESEPVEAEPSSSSLPASDEADKEWMDGMRMGEPLDPALQSTPAPDGTPRYSVEFVKFPITDFVEFMSLRIEQQVKLSDAVAKRADELAVTLTAKDQPAEAIFEQSLSPIGLRANKVDKIWVIEEISTPGSDTDE